MTLTLEQDRLRQRNRRAALTPAQRDECNLKARERMGRLRRACGVPTRAERWARHRLSRPARVAHVKPGPAPKPRKPQVPSEVRDAYRRAHPNSVIRRRFPTWADLERGWSA